MAGYAINSRALLHIAFEARKRAAETPAQSLVTIVFSAIGVESFVNEILTFLRWEPYPGESAAVSALRDMATACDLSRTPLRTKLQIIYATLSGRPFDQEQQPYLDFDLLIALRNAIVHDRPERIEVRDGGGREGPPLNVVRRLAARQIIELPDEADTAYPAWVSITNAAVAAWAFEAALTMARALAEAFVDPVWHSRLLTGFSVFADLE